MANSKFITVQLQDAFWVPCCEAVVSTGQPFASTPASSQYGSAILLPLQCPASLLHMHRHRAIVNTTQPAQLPFM